MSRYERPEFKKSELDDKTTDEERNSLIFDWWCDEGNLQDPAPDGRESDRVRYIESLEGKPTPIPSRAAHQDDPAPPITIPAPQGFRTIYLLSHRDDVYKALTNTEFFSNRPYSALGGASFILGLDPGADKGDKGVDWHKKHRALIAKAVDYPAQQVRQLAGKAVAQAALMSLARPRFDMAEFAEQAALRAAGILFGYGFQDHTLLEETSRATYRALQYIAVGQHFTTEPGTLPAAQQALARLTARTSELMDEYTRLYRSPRRYGPKNRRDWPAGVQPWSDLGLSALGEPLLQRLPEIPDSEDKDNGHPHPYREKGQTLSGRDRAIVASTLLAGTLGNIQSAACLLMQHLLTDPKCNEAVRKKILAMSCEKLEEVHEELEKELASLMCKLPPVPVLPRRTLKEVPVSDGTMVPADTDCLLLLEALPGCPHIWGDVQVDGPAIHPCLGRQLSLPVIAALVHHTLGLPNLRVELDPLNGETPKVERLWGFLCTKYGLRYDQQLRKQQNLIIRMPVKPPISENALRLRHLIAAGAPRIDHVLTEFKHLHFAWFEFTEGDRELVLRTVYDGDFEPYVQHFALFAGDLFDGLFEYLEGAPPRPVAEHPQEFVEVLRQLNRSPLGGYLFSAYPRVGADEIRGRAGGPP